MLNIKVKVTHLIFQCVTMPIDATWLNCFIVVETDPLTMHTQPIFTGLKNHLLSCVFTFV